MIQLTSDQANELKQEPHPPHVLVGGEEYVLIQVRAYERLKSVVQFEDGPLTRQEQASMLRQAGLRAGWDDPAMDIYDDLDPRKQP